MRANAGLLGIGLMGIAVLIAMFVGVTTAILPWWFVLLALFPFVLLWAGAKWPLLVIIFYLLASFGFLPLDPVKTDMIVMASVGFFIAVHWRQIPEVFQRYKSYWLLLSILLLWAFLMAVYGHFYRGNPKYFTFSEFISVYYWVLTIPILIYSSDLRRTENILKIILFVSSVLAFLSVFQSIFQMRLSFSALATAAELKEDQGGIAGLARSYTPGVVLLIFVIVLSVLKLVADGVKNKWFWGFMLLLNTLGVFVTFGRTTWTVTVLSIFLASALAGSRYFLKVLFFVSMAGVIMVVMSLAFNPDILIGIVNRLLSVRDEFSGRNTSLQWRIMENAYAIKSIVTHPFLGIGLGGEYKPRLTDNILTFFGQTFYVHNGYFYVIVKMGFVGLFLYLINYGYIFSRVWNGLARSALADVAPLIAFVSVYLGVLLLNIFQPEFMQGPSIAVLASLGGFAMALSYWRRYAAASML